MKSTILRAVYPVIHKKLKNPQLVNAVLLCIDKFEENFFPNWYTDIFFQNDRDWHPFSIYESYAFYCLHNELGLGNIIYAEIDLGEKPNSDRYVNDLNYKLKKLWPPFEGEFWGGNQGEDGYIFIDKPIKLSVNTIFGVEKFRDDISGRFPLEVGTTDIFKTLTYLNSGVKRLARWPYNSTKIYLLARN